MSKHVANGERPAKATQRRAKSSEKKKGVETGRKAPKVNKTKAKAQSRPRIERASKDEVVTHNRSVPRSNRGCPIPAFMKKRLPSPFKSYVLTAFYCYDNARGSRRTVAMKRRDGKVRAMSYARFVYQIVHGRLSKSIHVDHIDDNCLNDNVRNLQAITPLENAQKQAHANGLRQVIDAKCFICGSTFTVCRNQTYLGGGKKPLPTCSRSCGGKLSHMPLTYERKKKHFLKCIIKEYTSSKFHKA